MKKTKKNKTIHKKKIIILTISLGVVGFLYSNSQTNVEKEPVATVLSTNHVSFSFDKMALTPPPSSFNNNVELINQNPELYNGCEVTSLAMLLNFKGVNVDKVTLANEMAKDETPISKDGSGNILIWGNPKNGFVGSVSGSGGFGFSIDPKPLLPLVNKYYKDRAIDLTNTSLADIEYSIYNGNPVVAWVTGDMTLPYDFQTWTDLDGNTVKGTLSTHAVLLTGFDEKNIYYNDPLSSYKNASISKEDFLKVWEAMGKKALTVS